MPGDDPAAERQRYFEALFAKEDPWNYGSAYEVEKYLRQLAMLPEGPIDQALELACAEGHFTLLLAPRVGHLLATDISQAALARAAARCARYGNVDFRALDFAAEKLPPGMDLVVCSEVLYYLAGEAELRQVAAGIAAALRPGGWLVTAHARMVQDEPGGTGFDFGLGFGAASIHRVLRETPGFVLERAIVTDLYRIDRFRRVGNDMGAPAALPVTEQLGFTQLDPAVARLVVWGDGRH